MDAHLCFFLADGSTSESTIIQTSVAVGISLAVVLMLIGNIVLFRLRGQMIKAFMLRLMQDYALGTTFKLVALVCSCKKQDTFKFVASR